MKRNCIIFLLSFTVFAATGQDVREYIAKGDEAMENLDYILAKVYYDEVIFLQCNKHVIKQLTTIWLADESIRADMTDVMKRCHTCLDNDAKSLRDTASINLLIIYYMHGIGTNKNEAMAESWSQVLEDIHNPHIAVPGPNIKKPPRNRQPMQFFAGYSASLLAPFGLTVGGTGRTAGWYLRVRSNLSFQGHTAECNADGIISGGLGDYYYEPLEGGKVKTFIGTGGLMVKAARSFYISAGVGYCSREKLEKFRKIDPVQAEPPLEEFWAKRTDKKSTFSGVALDLDGTIGIGKKVYGSAGVSILNFESYSANVGIYVFF